MVVNGVIILGGVMVVIAFFLENKLLNLLPPNMAFNALQLKLFQALSVVVLLAGVYFKGGYGTEMEWRKRVADVEAKLKVAEAKSNIVTEKIIIQTKEKIVYVKQYTASVSSEINSNLTEIDKYPISPEAVRIYNKSVNGPEEKK
jgi:hypothetical protein